jgi:hypothetical protein
VKRGYRFFQITLLTWSLHRLALEIFGFPVFSFSNFHFGEFVVDVGVYLIAFGISYGCLAWR